MRTPDQVIVTGGNMATQKLGPNTSNPPGRRRTAEERRTNAANSVDSNTYRAAGLLIEIVSGYQAGGDRARARKVVDIWWMLTDLGASERGEPTVHVAD